MAEDEVPGPELGLEAEAANDPQAQLELRNQERLERIDSVRTEGVIRAIWHSGWIAVFGMYFAAFVITVTITLWFWHFLAPAKWCWISDEHLAKIQAVLFSGSAGALLSSAVQRYLGNGKQRRD